MTYIRALYSVPAVRLPGIAPNDILWDTVGTYHHAMSGSQTVTGYHFPVRTPLSWQVRV